ncbi:hypothetical protein ACOSQ2_031586 [Xanthoceras sorbifolium]
MSTTPFFLSNPEIVERQPTLTQFSPKTRFASSSTCPGIFDGMSFDGRSLVEWNIDGQFEYQIMQTLKHIMMYTQAEQLINLKCPSLSHFRWYKNIFFSKVFQRKDSSMDFWKERFLDGLPTLFAERVRTRIKNKYGGSIPWHALTYGDISSEIVAEGLAICTEQKQHRKQEKGSTKKTMGDFCEQYGYNESSSKPPKHRSASKNYKPFKKKKFFKRSDAEQDQQRRQIRRKKPYLNTGKQKRKKTPICYRCGKIGHYSSSCKTKEKINALSCSDEMKHYMEKVILTDSDEEDEIDYIDDISDTSSDFEFAESSSSSEEEEQCNCDHYKSILKLNGLSINMLRQEDSLILDCIDAIDDPEKKRSAMEKLLSMASKKPSEKQLEIPK